MAEEKERSLDETLSELMKQIQMTVDKINDNRPENLKCIENVIKEIPGLKHTSQELAETLIQVSEDLVQQKAYDALDKLSEKYLGKVPLDDLGKKCLAYYESKGGNTENFYDEIIKVVKRMKEK